MRVGREGDGADCTVSEAASVQKVRRKLSLAYLFFEQIFPGLNHLSAHFIYTKLFYTFLYSDNIEY